jgi:hypothetical protein
VKEDDEVLSLATLGQGAAVEKFDLELEKTLKNILDPNTAGGAREIVLTVKLKPNDSRSLVEIEVQCKSNLRPLAAFSTAAAIGRGGGRVEARELVQQRLPGMDGNITRIDERRNNQ